MLALSYAKLLAYAGKLDASVEHARTAVGRQPRNLNFRFQLATLLMDLSRWDEARAVIEEMERNRHWSGFRDREIDSLRDMFERVSARAASAS